MQKTVSLLLLCAIALVAVASAEAAQTTVTPTGAPTDPSVARVAYLEDKVATPEPTVANGQGNCCDTCCEDTCCESCCQPCLCGNPGIIGGYDFLWLKPHFSNAVSYASVFDDGADEVETLFGYPADYSFTPRFWLGYKGYNGLGFRVRYEQFDQQLMNEGLTAPADTTLYYEGISAAAGEELHFQNWMELHVVDFDFTKDFEWRCATLTAGAGLRYAKIQYNSVGHVSDVAVLETVASERGVEGIGPTVFVDFKAPIRQSALSLVGGLRGSVLFGRSRGTLVWTDLIEEESYTERGNGNRTMGVLEGSLGLQYDRCLTNGVEGFVRLAWEGQLWLDAGSPTTPDSDMGMEGLCIAVGINR